MKQALGVVWADVCKPEERQTEIHTALVEPVHFGARVLRDYWQDRCAHGGLVIGKDVPSRQVASILRNLLVYEPVDDGGDFLVRLAGSAALRRFGRDVTGLKMSALFPRPVFERRRDVVNAALRTGEPFIRDVRVTRDGRPELRFEFIGVPALSPDRAAKWLLSGIFFYDWTR